MEPKFSVGEEVILIDYELPTVNGMRVVVSKLEYWPQSIDENNVNHGPGWHYHIYPDPYGCGNLEGIPEEFLRPLPDADFKRFLEKLDLDKPIKEEVTA